MSKREPLQDWYGGSEPAPKTTVLQVWPTWDKSWVVYPKGTTDEPLPFYATWQEAWDAALKVEGLR